MRLCRCDRAWQPLQTPRVKVCGRAKKARNDSDSRGWCSIDSAQPRPAPRTSPKEKPPHRAMPLRSSSLWRPSSRSLVVRSMAVKPARVKAAAISRCPLLPCSRRMPTDGRWVVGGGRGGSDGRRANRGGGAARLCHSAAAVFGLSRSLMMSWLTVSHAWRRVVRGSLSCVFPPA